MTDSTIAAPERTAENGDFCRMERAVRLLLNRARKSQHLAEFPLAEAICNALGVDNPVAAVRKVVEDTFEGGGSTQTWLRDLILNNDIENDVLRSDAARRENMSRRQFQRCRANAVAAIARHLLRLVGPGSLDPEIAAERTLENFAELAAESEPGAIAELCKIFGADAPFKAQLRRLGTLVDAGTRLTEASLAEFSSVPGSLAFAHMAYACELNGDSDGAERAVERAAALTRGTTKYDVMTRFELERLAFLRAFRRGDAGEMVAVARSLRRNASAPRSVALASLVGAEAAIAIGDLDAAEHFLNHAELVNLRRSDLLQTATATHVRAKIALCRGDAAAADLLATGAYAALSGRHVDARACAATIARARIRLGARWTLPDFAGALDPHDFDRLTLECERARYLASAGDAAAAHRIARPVHAAATALGFEGLAARAAVALGDGGAMHAALATLLASRNRGSAFDAFAPALGADLGFGPFAVDDALAGVLYSRILVAVPQMTSDAPEARPATLAFVRDLLAWSVSDRRISSDLERSIKALHRRGAALAQYARGARDDLQEIFGLALYAAAPQRYAEGSSRIRTAFDSLVATPVSGRRTFAIDARDARAPHQFAVAVPAAIG